MMDILYLPLVALCAGFGVVAFGAPIFGAAVLATKLLERWKL